MPRLVPNGPRGLTRCQGSEISPCVRELLGSEAGAPCLRAAVEAGVTLNSLGCMRTWRGCPRGSNGLPGLGGLGWQRSFFGINRSARLSDAATPPPVCSSHCGAACGYLSHSRAPCGEEEGVPGGCGRVDANGDHFMACPCTDVLARRDSTLECPFTMSTALRWQSSSAITKGCSNKKNLQPQIQNSLNTYLTEANTYRK